MRGQVRALLLAKENRARIFPRKLRLLRTVADDHLRSRQIEREERFEILLHRDAAHGHEDRPRQIQRNRVVGIEQLGVHAARPEAELAKSTRGKFLAQRIRCDHDHRRGGMKVTQHRIADAGRQPGAHLDIFREARGVGRGKRKLATTAIGAHGPADRAFGRDMDGVRRSRLDPPRDLAPVRQRDAQPRIGRQRHRRKAVRREKADVGIQRRSAAGERGQRADDAVNLRMPRVGRYQYLHVLAQPGFDNDSRIRRWDMDISGV